MAVRAMKNLMKTLTEFHNELELPHDFRITCLLHPSTYLNKVLLGSQDGRMQLWNIRTMYAMPFALIFRMTILTLFRLVRRLLYEFKRLESSVTSLAQAPSVDVVAVGLLDGSVILQNIKVDEKIMRLKQEGKVTAISFRTGENGLTFWQPQQEGFDEIADDKHIMATASMHGDIALWDLDTRKLFHIMKEAHDGAVHTMQFYNGQPILITAGSDNSIKVSFSFTVTFLNISSHLKQQWIFDNLDGHERLLRSRSGHYQPPSQIRHYGGEGQLILSAGRDRTLRTFSTFRDVQNVELSQGSLERKSKNLGLKVEELKLPQILGFDACEFRTCNMPCPEKWSDIDKVVSQLMRNSGIGITSSHVTRTMGRGERGIINGKPSETIFFLRRIPCLLRPLLSVLVVTLRSWDRLEGW